MPVVVTAGARAVLDSSRTDEESLGVCFGLFAELDDGRRIDVDPAAYKVDGPRRGAGALWGSITVDPSTLPSLDRTWFARDPLEAATHALEASFTLRPEYLEEFIRSELSDGPPPAQEPPSATALKVRASTAMCRGRISWSPFGTPAWQRRLSRFVACRSAWSSTRICSWNSSADATSSAVNAGRPLVGPVGNS
jgi:hypothetical protein